MSLNILQRLERIKECCHDKTPKRLSKGRMCTPCKKHLMESIKHLEQAYLLTSAQNTPLSRPQ